MAKQVIKKGGKKEAFKAQKIEAAIRAAAKEARLPAARVKTMVGKVSRAVLKFASKRKIIATATLRKEILKQLDKVEPAVARAWRKHGKKRRSRKR